MFAGIGDIAHVTCAHVAHVIIINCTLQSLSWIHCECYVAHWVHNLAHRVPNLSHVFTFTFPMNLNIALFLQLSLLEYSTWESQLQSGHS
jgi:hypothetical protein